MQINNVPYGNISSLAPGQTSTVFCMYGGEYATVNVVSGSNYTFSTCGGSWDTQLTLYSSLGGASLAYNDDFCGLQSQINWTATFTGQVRVVLDRYPCSSYNSCMNLNVTRGANVADPCQNSVSANCNQSIPYTLSSGNGAWNPPGPWGTPGNEQVIEFTATVSGVQSISVTHSGGGWVDLFIKTGACNGNSWTYVDDIFSSGTNNISLNAGTTYYFLIDDENTSASSGSFSITCPTPAANPCNSVTELTCGVTSSATLGSGNGAWNPPGPWGTPGKEKVFSYTAPSSGAYDIAVTTSSAWVDLFYKSGTCGSTGWTYVNDISSSETNSLNLIGGVTYYFLIDDENTSSNSVSINISCPCIPPPGGIDNSIVVTSNTSYASTTVGACDDCSYRSSNDRVLEMEITCAGNYTISTCGGASWDTYLYLSTAPCGGSLIAINDDNCGLQSSITTFLSVGTYYLTVEGFSSLSQGAFTVDISKSCGISLELDPTTVECGYNISCNGLSDGIVFSSISNYCGELTYNWSNGSTTSDLSGVPAGNYSLFVSDDFGCSANASVTFTEPNALNVSAGNDQTVYYGYTPLSCADLNGSASGGCAEYSYSWSDGGLGTYQGEDINVCPSMSSDYTLTVTDQNGCSASDAVNVCVVDVTCFAGNSQNQKVEVICAGDYTFTTCGLAAWDTYLYLSDQPCGGTIISFNDDDCGLQSTISANLSVGTYYLAVEGFSTLSLGDFELAISTTCGFAPLPVELLYFQGENQGRENHLTWHTLTEVNNDFFLLERSQDGIEFVELANISGNGTTSEPTDYLFIDETFSPGVNYYRLKQVDYNGQEETFKTVAISNQFEEELTIYPNPAKNIIRLHSKGQLINPTIILQNALGEIVRQEQYTSGNSFVLGFGEIPGVYLINIVSGNEVITRKLIVH